MGSSKKVKMRLAELRKRETNLKSSTLAFLVKEGEVLLAVKKRGYGVSKWNGVGGKIEKNESVEEAFLREVEEEIGVVAVEHRRQAVLHFYDPHNGENNFKVHVFVVSEWRGKEGESEEMRPEWFSHKDIPYENMWPDDRHWLPYVLSGKKIEAHFLFDESTEIAEHEIVEL